MFKNLKRKKHIISSLIVCLFTVSIVTSTLYLDSSFAQELPVATEMLEFSNSFKEFNVIGIHLSKSNPFEFEFLFNQGQAKYTSQSFEEEASKLIRYFLAILTMPERQLWVNLSPYEPDRIIDDSLRDTELGQNLLAQDYLLKQLTSSMTDPVTELGKKYWQLSSFENFSKVWIKPDEAIVNVQDNRVYLEKASLALMSEQDYLAYKQNSKVDICPNKAINKLLPKLTEEVNNGSHFKELRQIYNCYILATWFKNHYLDSIFKNYYNNKKLEGIFKNNKEFKTYVFDQYRKSFEEGVYKKIVKQSGQKRHYSSGGIVLSSSIQLINTNKSYANTYSHRVKVRFKPISKITSSTLEPYDNINGLVQRLETFIAEQNYSGVDDYDLMVGSEDDGSWLDEKIKSTIDKGHLIRLELTENGKKFPTNNIYARLNDLSFMLARAVAGDKKSVHDALYYGIFETLKNAIVHGNRLDRSIPIYLYVDKWTREIKVFNAMNRSIPQASNDFLIDMNLSGDHVALETLTKKYGWEHKRYDRNNVTVTELRRPKEYSSVEEDENYIFQCIEKYDNRQELLSLLENDINLLEGGKELVEYELDTNTLFNELSSFVKIREIVLAKKLFKLKFSDKGVNLGNFMVHDRIKSFAQLVANALFLSYEKTNIAVSFSIKELIKNAYSYGNRLDPNLPIYFTIDPESYQIRVYNIVNSDEGVPDERTLRKYVLSGHHEAVDKINNYYELDYELDKALNFSCAKVSIKEQFKDIDGYEERLKKKDVRALSSAIKTFKDLDTEFAKLLEQGKDYAREIKDDRNWDMDYKMSVIKARKSRRRKTKAVKKPVTIFVKELGHNGVLGMSTLMARSIVAAYPEQKVELYVIDLKQARDTEKNLQANSAQTDELPDNVTVKYVSNDQWNNGKYKNKKVDLLFTNAYAANITEDRYSEAKIITPYVYSHRANSYDEYRKYIYQSIADYKHVNVDVADAHGTIVLDKSLRKMHKQSIRWSRKKLLSHRKAWLEKTGMEGLIKRAEAENWDALQSVWSFAYAQTLDPLERIISVMNNTCSDTEFEQKWLVDNSDKIVLHTVLGAQIDYSMFMSYVKTHGITVLKGDKVLNRGHSKVVINLYDSGIANLHVRELLAQNIGTVLKDSDGNRVSFPVLVTGNASWTEAVSVGLINLHDENDCRLDFGKVLRALINKVLLLDKDKRIEDFGEQYRKMLMYRVQGRYFHELDIWTKEAKYFSDILFDNFNFIDDFMAEQNENELSSAVNKNSDQINAPTGGIDLELDNSLEVNGEVNSSAINISKMPSADELLGYSFQIVNVGLNKDKAEKY